MPLTDAQSEVHLQLKIRTQTQSNEVIICNKLPKDLWTIFFFCLCFIQRNFLKYFSIGKKKQNADNLLCTVPNRAMLKYVTWYTDITLTYLFNMEENEAMFTYSLMIDKDIWQETFCASTTGRQSQARDEEYGARQKQEFPRLLVVTVF